MRKLIAIVQLFLIHNYVYAINDDSAILNKANIIIHQRFEGHGDGDHVPTFGGSLVYLIDEKNEKVDSLVISSRNSKYICKNIEYKDNIFYIKDNKGERKIIDKIIVKSHINKINSVDSIAVFEFVPKSDKEQITQIKRKCASASYDEKWYDFILGGHSNSYTLETFLSCDLPIPIEVKNVENEENGETSIKICIDDKKPLSLKLDDYYERGKTRIRYNVNNKNGWFNIFADFNIKPNGNIKLYYHNIVGSEGTDMFKTSLGKFITIRVEKQLQDGTWTYSQDVRCRFYSKGPEFQIVNIERSSCGKEPLSIKVYSDDKNFGVFLNNDNCKYNVIHAPDIVDKPDNNITKDKLGNSISFTLTDCAETDEPNEYLINGEGDNGKLSDYLKNDNNTPTEGWWFFQLAYTDPEMQGYEFNSEPFQLPAKSAPLVVNQVFQETVDIDDDPQNNPHLYLNIDDPFYRLDYNIYYAEKDDKNANHVNLDYLHPITAPQKSSDNLDDDLRNEFNNHKDYKKWSFGKGKKDIFKEFYYDKKSSLIKSTIIIDQNGHEPTTGWDISANDLILRTTHEEENDEGEYETYTYLCKFKVGGYPNYDPSYTSYIRFKGEVAEHIGTYKNIDSHTYILSYETGTGVCITNQFTGPDPNSSYGGTTQIYRKILANNSGFNLLQYLGKGNGYYLVKMLEGGTGLAMLIDMSAFSEEIGFKSINAYVFEDYDNINVINANTIVCDDGEDIEVWHNNSFYSTYSYDDNEPNIYSFQDADNGAGFTYLMDGKKYYRRYKSYSLNEMYDFSSSYEVSIIDFDKEEFDKEWVKFYNKRNEKWREFLNSKKLDKYVIYNFPKKNALGITPENGENIYSGYLVIKDKDGCPAFAKENKSDTLIEYQYKYTDLTYSYKVEQYPSSLSGENGVITLTATGYSQPYKCIYKGKEYDLSTSIPYVGYSNKMTFIDKNGKEFIRDVNIDKLSCKVTEPYKCEKSPGKIKFEKKTSNLNPTNWKIFLKNCETDEVSSQINYSETIPVGSPGTYRVYGVYNSTEFEITEKELVVKNEPFSVKIEETTDATDFKDPKGTVTLKATNFSGNWSVSNQTFNTEKGLIELPAKNEPYSDIKATNSKGCEVTLDAFSIKQPDITFPNSNGNGGNDNVDAAAATISYNENNNTATIDMECGMEGSMTELTLYLLNKKDDKIADNSIVKDTQNKGVISTTTTAGTQKLSSTFNYSTNSTYYIYAKYKAGNATTCSTICLTEDRISPLTLDGCKAESSDSNKDRCYNSPATINLVGNCTFEIKGVTINSDSYETEEYENEVKVILNKKEKVDMSGGFTIAQSVTREDVIQIEEISQPIINLWVKDVTCFGASDGVIKIKSAENIKTTKDNLFLQIIDKPQAKELDNLEAGIYNVTVIDGSCEYPLYEKVLGPSSPLKISVIETVDPTCTNDNGTIKVAPEGGWGEYIFAIDEKPTIPDTFAEFCKDETYIASNSTNKTHLFGALSFGEHTAYVSDNKGCTQSVSEELYEYVNPKVTGALFDSVWCYGGENGTIKKIEFTTDDQVSDGDPMKMYYSTNPDKPSVESNWIDFSQTINNLKSADYYIWLKDKNQCVSDGFYNIHVDQPKPLKISISQQNNIIREYNHDGGSVTIEVEGGNKGQFNIFLNDTASECIGYAKWDGQETFTDIFAPDKTHKLFVVDYKKCTDSVETGYMRQPKGPLKVNGIPHPALCNKAQGSIKIAAEGGWGHYSYTYNLVNDTIIMQSQMDSVQVGGGQYVLTVIDSAGVMAYDTVTVPIPTDTLLANNLSRAAYCGSDGVISVDISGGTAPYTIETNFGVNPFKTMGGITTFTETKPKGTYVVYISDLNECKFTVPVTIVDSSVVVSIKRRYPSMRQYANGRLEAVATRGRAPYTYLWTHCNSGQTCTSAVWDNVPAGTYRLDVNDKAGCQPPVKIIYLATNDDLPLIINGKEGETGPDAQNGWASFSSDTSGFTQMILRRAMGEEIDVIDKVDDQLNFKLTGLAPGDYVLECTLPKGEVRYAEFSIAKYIPMALFVTDIDHASQPGASDGSASLQITGGVAPYVVQIVHNDRFYADTSLNGHQLKLPQLSAGIYTMIVIDHYNKRENTSFLIKEPDEPLQLRAEQIDPSCFGSTNGRIELRATGGWNDYEYALIGDDYGRRTIYDNRKAKESYTFVVIDSKGITDTLAVELTQPDPLRAGVKKIDSVSCFDGSDGAVTFEITGGTAPYVVKYNELYGKQGNYVDSLHAGQNTFRFSDANLCKSEDDGLVVDIPQPDELVIANDSVTHTTCSNNNGKIDIEIAGGIAPYTINWLENGLPTERLQGKTSIDSLRQSGLYRLQVVDDKKCETPYREYRINSSSGPKITNVLTLPVRCVGDSTGTAVIDSADVIPATPYSPFRIEWPHGENTMSVNNLPAGWNEVFVIDSNNCKTSKSFNIGAATPIRIQKIGSREPSCYGYTNGQINLDVDGGVGGFRYLWNTGDTLKDITSIGMGSYTIIATDGNNCHDTATFSIGQPDSLHVEIGEENVLMCPDNTYEFTATAGFKTYSWMLDSTVLSTKRNLIASDGGEYYLEATYGANCISRDTVTISIGDDLLEADFYMASDAAVDTALALVELSNMQIDSLHWEFSPTDFVVMDSADYELYLKPLKIGQHEITLWAYSGGCVSYITKQVEISELADTASNINLGYNPLIKSVDVMPNPTKGRFSIRVKLREDYNAEVSVSSAGQGKPVERRELSGKSEYEESFDLSNAGDGVYILRIVAGSEQRVAKVLLTK